MSSVSRATPHSRPRSLRVVYRLLPVSRSVLLHSLPPSLVLTVGKVGQRRIEAVSNPEKKSKCSLLFLFFGWPPLAALVISLCCCCFVDVASHFPSTRLVHNYITTRRPFVHSSGKYPATSFILQYSFPRAIFGVRTAQSLIISLFSPLSRTS